MQGENYVSNIFNHLLIISIALVVFFCTKVKMNPAIALILGSLLLGVLTKVPLNDITAADGTVTNGLITVINNGFGNMMGSIGFPIGLGIILGQFVSDTGGATVIADSWCLCSLKNMLCML